jgi:putative cell wall-binding protein
MTYRPRAVRAKSACRRPVAAGLTLALGVGVGLVAMPAVSASATPTAHAVVTASTRIAGASRYDTAVAASQDQFATAGSAKAVVITRGDTYPDALAGGPLAAKLGGPLLLTPSTSLLPAVQTELLRVLPKGGTVYILGGTSAISSSVEAAITELGFTIQRIAGADRFSTAVAIADAMGDPTTVFEATGLNYPDALAGGPAAIKAGAAILLTNGATQSPATAAYLSAHTGGTHYALGGPAAAADKTATAIAGADRYETAAAIDLKFFTTPTVVGVATGSNFPDALAAAPDLGTKGAPLLLVASTGSIPEGATGALLGNGKTTTSSVIFGGLTSVSSDVATQVANLASVGATATAESTSAAYTGEFGVLALHEVPVGGTASDTTQVFDGGTGDSTAYEKGSGSTAVTGLPTSAQLAALPTSSESALETAVNTTYAALYKADGGTSTNADDEFLVNAEQVILDPNALPALRLAVYEALADLPGTAVESSPTGQSGVAGVGIAGQIAGVSGLTGDVLVYFFDPATLSPLEDDITSSDGKTLVLSTAVTSFTTAPTAPADPYTS